jgi:hypothetical protein
VQNIPYEAFSPFSATYEQVRKVSGEEAELLLEVEPLR